MARIRFIKRAQQLRFSLKEVKELLFLRVDPHTTCADIRTRAEEKIADVQEKIRTLQKMKKALTRLTAACNGRGPVGALGFRARARRGYGPFATGVLTSGMVVVGKFVTDSPAAMYVGIAGLVAASFWNAWPQKTKAQRSCPACVPTGAASRETGDTETTVEEASI